MKTRRDETPDVPRAVRDARWVLRMIDEDVSSLLEDPNIDRLANLCLAVLTLPQASTIEPDDEEED